MTTMFAFDFEQKTWEVYKEVNKADEPEGRSDFDMLVHEGSIWLFGGSNGKKTLSDFWKLDPKDRKWQQVNYEGGPEVARDLGRDEEDTQ